MASYQPDAENWKVNLFHLLLSKLKDSQKAPVCPDLQHISGGAGSKPSALTDDYYIPNKVCISCFIQLIVDSKKKIQSKKIKSSLKPGKRRV